MQRRNGKKRHSAATRLWHWVNLAAVSIMFMSGLNIFNAHPRLYWGDWGFERQDAWLVLQRFPHWLTIPNYYSLAAARDWHIVFAWVLALSLLFYMVASLINGHFVRDLFTKWSDWRPSNIAGDIRAHLNGDFHRGGGKYNFLQKAAYSVVIFILLPCIIATGIVMSPGMEPAVPWMTEMFGGRQSARSIHFICAFSLVAFFIVHLVLVLLSKPITQIWAMITGGKSADANPPSGAGEAP